MNVDSPARTKRTPIVAFYEQEVVVVVVVVVVGSLCVSTSGLKLWHTDQSMDEGMSRSHATWSVCWPDILRIISH